MPKHDDEGEGLQALRDIIVADRQRLREWYAKNDKPFDKRKEKSEGT
jgi:hypothetical protein